MTAPAAPTAPNHRGTRREVAAWVMYDWANSAWSTLTITIVVGYISTVVLPSDWGPFWYANIIGASMFVAAILSPVIGALADARATKRFWLALTAMGGAGSALLMALVPENLAWLILVLFFIGSLGFELSFGFYNGFLPEITDDTTVNRVSAWGFGAGYVGGGLALLVALAVLFGGGMLGLPDGSSLTRDYNACTMGQFGVSLPEGVYEVRLWLGDPAHAHPRIAYQLPGIVSQSAGTSAGEVIERMHPVTVAGGDLVVTLGDGADNSPTPIAGLAVTREGKPVVQFDFGAAGSPVEAGFIPVTPGDKFGVHDVVTEKKLDAAQLSLPAFARRDGDQLPPGAAPAGLARFGWQSGDVTARDVVTPLRLRIGLAINGLWWGLFALPCLLLLRDKIQPSAQRQPFLVAARGAFAQVGSTIRHVRLYPTLAIFLLGFLLYNDGMQTVISQASVFAQKELRMTTGELGQLILMIQFVSLPGALFVGWLSDRIGQKRTLVGTLAIWIGLIVAAFFVTTKAQFWAMGLVLALVMGGAQSVSRAIMGRMTPETRAAEFMGFFNFSGKATSVLGPVLFGNILKFTGSAHWAILSLLVFFVLGTLLVLPVNVARGQREALAEA